MDRAIVTVAIAIAIALQLAPSGAFGQPASVEGPGKPPGADKSLKTRALEAGAALLQRTAPLHHFDIYLSGFHPMKDKPGMQLIAHHYCRQVNQDFAQCVLFDGNTEMANMNGVEYIISERLFKTLPAEERKYWHPHNGEILAGQLVAPGIPQAAEHALMKQKMNSYGKTWHMWNTGHAGAAGDALPLGDPMLAWSFSRFGELDPTLQAARDRAQGIDTEQKRRYRADLRKFAEPQSGVDDLKGQFPRPTSPIPGVVDIEAAAPVR